LTGEKGGGLISLSAKKAGGLKAFYTLRTTTFCPNKGDRLRRYHHLIKTNKERTFYRLFASKKICKCIEK